MLKKMRKSDSGFTIIEVMIVLAIAALILLIVLLAVPALQRNSRNTSIKNDASAVVSAINEYKSNNDGASPGKLGTLSSGGTVTIEPATAGSSANATAKVQGNTTVEGTDTPPTVAPDIGTIVVLYKQKCLGTAYNDASAVTANSRSVAVIYSAEQSGGAKAGRCIDS